jgi:hypothetical protein
MAISDHARLAPSAAYRWATGGCAAAPSIAALYPEKEESDASREGTAAHHALAEMLLKRPVASGDVAPNGVTIDQDMIENALDVVHRLNGRYVRVEEKVTITTVHKDCWGTPDMVHLDIQTRELTVYDYKYGHRYVDVFQNPQLMLYAIGVLECNDITDWSSWTIKLVIIQPRCYHPEGTWREWSLSGTELDQWANKFYEAAIFTTMDEPKAKTGEHCRNCPGLLHCQAALRSGMSAIDVAFSARPIELTPQQVGILLHWLREAQSNIKMLVDATEEEALRLLREGTDIPLFRADYSRGRERWTKPAAEVFAIGDLLGVDLRKPQEPITPAQARKSGLDTTVVAGYSEKPQGSLTLIPVTEKYIKRAFS